MTFFEKAAASIAAVLLAGCMGKTSGKGADPAHSVPIDPGMPHPSPSSVPPQPSPGSVPDPTDMTVDGSVDHRPVPGDNATINGPSRDAVRMSLSQFNRSINAIFGAPWTMSDPSGTRLNYGDFAYTLGAADYYSRIAEDLSPQMLFARGVEEGAIAVCGDAMASDPMKPAAERAVLRKIDDPRQATPAQVDANLADMKLRFHGIDVHGDPSKLDGYRTLFNRVAALDPANGPSNGWYAVCVAMITDDAFAIF